VGEVVHLAAHGFARAEDIGLGQSRRAIAGLHEQVAAQKRPTRTFHEEAALPAVGQAWRIEPCVRPPARDQGLAVTQGTRHPVGQVLHRDHRGDAAADGQGMGCHRQELIERAAFVRFDVREPDPTQPVHGKNLRDRLGTRSKVRRVPVWNSSGSSSSTRSWFNEKPPGTTAGGIGVVIRKMSSATSSMPVPHSRFVTDMVGALCVGFGDQARRGHAPQSRFSARLRHTQ
jgi:hypothetical protein